MKNKKLEMPIIVLIVVIIVVVTTVMVNHNRTNVDPNLNIEDSSSEESDGSDEISSGEIKNSETEENKMYATINGEKLEIQLEDNATAVAFAKMLPLELTMNDLNGNEKYVNLDGSLPTNSYEPGRVETGDVMLYGDDCLVIFYDSFDTEYSYTKIGHIDSLPELGDGKLIVEFSVE